MWSVAHGVNNTPQLPHCIQKLIYCEVSSMFPWYVSFFCNTKGCLCWQQVVLCFFIPDANVFGLVTAKALVSVEVASNMTSSLPSSALIIKKTSLREGKIPFLEFELGLYYVHHWARVGIERPFLFQRVFATYSILLKF